MISGSGEVYTDEGREPAAAGDVVLTPAGHWHGFDNTSDEEVLLIWGWRGAGLLAAAGHGCPRTTDLAADPRVRVGMEAQPPFASGASPGARHRWAGSSASDRPRRWRGLGSPPLVGFLTDRSAPPPDDVPRIDDWTRPVVEPEVAVRLGADLPPRR